MEPNLGVQSLRFNWIYCRKATLKVIGVKVMVTLASMFFESSSRNTWFHIIKHRRVKKMNGVGV